MSRKSHATDSAMPLNLEPQLATLAGARAKHLDASTWSFEIKFDGYRMLARIEQDRIQLFTRNGHDWTSKMPQLERDLKDAGLPEGWYDGEIVVLNDAGLPDFHLLQGAFKAKRARTIVFYLFDVLYCQGTDLRDQPLFARRDVLAQIVGQGTSSVRFSETLQGDLSSLLSSACAMGLEGIMAKRNDAPYVSGRTQAWLKLKCGQEQAFVVGGFTELESARGGFGALLLGVYNDCNELVYVGSVGTGFSERLIASIRTQLDMLLVDRCPFRRPPGSKKDAVQWVAPSLVVQVAFAERTSADKIRHAAFRKVLPGVCAEDVRWEE